MDRTTITILLVDSDQQWLDTISNALVQSTHPRFKVLTALTLEQAKQVLQVQLVALVVMELELADSGSLDSYVRLNASKNDVPIVILSHIENESVGQLALELGAQDYLYKSEFSAVRLGRAIRYSLTRYGLWAREHRFRELIKHHAEAILIIDSESEVRFVNDMAEQLFQRAASLLLVPFHELPLRVQRGNEVHILLPKGDFLVAEVRVAEIVWNGRFASMLSLREITRHRERANALARQVEELRAIHTIAVMGARSDDEDVLISTATHMVAELLSEQNVGVLLADEQKKRLMMHPSYHLIEAMPTFTTINYGEGIAGITAQTAEIQYVPDVRTDERYLQGNPLTLSELCVPLKVNDSVIGVLNAESRRLDAFSSDDHRFVETLTSQLALAIGRIRLRQEQQQQLTYLRLLNEITQMAIRQPTLTEMLPAIVEKLKAVFDAKHCLILLQRDERPFVITSTLPSHAIVDNLFLIEATTTLLEEQETHKQIPYGQNQVVVLFPFNTGHIWGALAFIYQKDSVHIVKKHLFMQQLVAQIGLAIARVRLLQDTQNNANELKSLLQISSALRVTQHVKEIVQITLNIVGQLGDFVSTIFLYDAEQDELVQQGAYPETLFVKARIKADEGLSGYVYQSQKTYVCDDVLHDPKARTLDITTDSVQPYSRAIVSPLLADQTVVGVLLIGGLMERPFTTHDKQLIETIASIVGESLHRAMVLESLENRVRERTQELEQANEQLQELDRMRSKFVSDMSHELRTPVTTINLYLDLLERGRPEKQAYYLSVLRHELNRLSSLIEESLRLSRLDVARNNSGRNTMNFTEVDLNKLLADLVASYLNNIESAELTLSFHPLVNLQPIWGVESQLSLAFGKLLENAIRYNQAQGQIYVTVEQDKEHVVVLVQDTGIGIEQKEIPRLFERFYRGEQVGQSNIPGSGLGLSIVKEVIELHNGSVEIQSELHQGSTFKILLPLDAS